MLNIAVQVPDWYKNPYAGIIRPQVTLDPSKTKGLAFKDMWPLEDFYGNGHSYNRELPPEFWARLARWERFKPKKYIDTVLKDGTEVWAIAFGHSGHSGVWPSQQEIIDNDYEFTYEQAWDILVKDIYAEYLPQLNKKIRPNVTNYMLGGILLTFFNMGQTKYRETVVLSTLETGRYLTACTRFLVLEDGTTTNNKSRVRHPDGTSELVMQNGLSCRRADEMSLYLTRVDKEGVLV